jgi:hypothetical protein
MDIAPQEIPTLSFEGYFFHNIFTKKTRNPHHPPIVHFAVVSMHPTLGRFGMQGALRHRRNAPLVPHSRQLDPGSSPG